MIAAAAKCSEPAAGSRSAELEASLADDEEEEVDVGGSVGDDEGPEEAGGGGDDVDVECENSSDGDRISKGSDGDCSTLILGARSSCRAL